MAYSFTSLKMANEAWLSIYRESLLTMGLPIIEGNLVQSQGFVIKIDDIEDLKAKAKQFGATLIILNITYYDESQELKSSSYDAVDMDTFDGEDISELPYSIDVFVRLGESNTWLNLELPSASSFFLVDVYDFNEEEDEYEEDEAPESEDLTIWRIEKSLEIAQLDGFCHLKNSDLRRHFVEDVAKKEGWYDYSLDNTMFSCISFATTAYNCYEYAILPEKTKKLHDEGKSSAEIAKLLGHTKNRIEKSLVHKISDGMLSAIELMRNRTAGDFERLTKDLSICTPIDK